MLLAILCLIFGYLCGSIPSGVIVTRLAAVEDPRGIGSKNIGATNVLRTGRKDLALITLLGDALKGLIPVLVAGHFDEGRSPLPLAALAACGAFLGHLFPLYIGFRGGKGVATFVGCLIALAWPAALAFAIVWIAIAILTRYSSAAALGASAVTPLVLALLGRRESAVLFALLAAILWVKHRSNIARLAAGTEHKIGGRRPAA